jgi:tetratricopeptide (TPR) repeat protein
LVPENWSIQELLNAGWSEPDLAWEGVAERTAEAVSQRDYVRAKEEAGQALRIARADFESIDPRLGTSLANYGLCLSLSGDSQGAAPLFQKALEAWRRADPWIARMTAPRVARSSLFHMRMEALHRDTYRARWQLRWRELADDAIKRLESLEAVEATFGPPTDDILARWQRERPAMLNDTRKLMAAAYLLLAPPAPSA